MIFASFTWCFLTYQRITLLVHHEPDARDDAGGPPDGVKSTDALAQKGRGQNHTE
jgi:hypothetical protein